MPRVRIKICGCMRPEDARAAAAAGADAIGLVCVPGVRRAVSIELARQIIAALPPFVTPVLLFVDAKPATIRETATALGVATVQLHGHEQPELLRALTGLRLTKAIKVDPATFANELEMWRNAIASGGLAHLIGIVLETAGQPGPGGTGVENDWETIAQAQADGLFTGLPPIIAAGGLSPETVGAVVRRLRPFAVDVSSGVEIDGAKSPERIRAFLNAAAG